MMAWSRRRRGPLPRGASRSDIEAAYPDWTLTDEAAFDISGTPFFRHIKHADPRLYRLRLDTPA